jgi:hypothetical protein
VDPRAYWKRGHLDQGQQKNELRDRLRAQAAREGLTLGAYLARLADAEDRRERLPSLKATIAATSSVEIATHSAESAEWESAELADQ